jgi:hypothetical protein
VSEGLYSLPLGFEVRIVVLSELPRTRATVLLRLGSRKLRAQAIAEILRMPTDAWERKTAEPFWYSTTSRRALAPARRRR